MPSPREATGAVVLPKRLTIAEAAVLHRQLQGAVERGGPVAVDGSQVAEIDTAGLQLLVCLWRTVGDCRWLDASDALRSAACLIGVAGDMGLGADVRH